MSRPDLKDLKVSVSDLRELRQRFVDNYGIDLKGDYPVVSIKIGHLKDLLAEHPDATEDYYLNLFLVSYRNDDGDKTRYVRKIDPTNVNPQPGDLKDSIEDMPSAIMTISPDSHGIDLTSLTAVLYDAGQICPPPTGSCKM